MTVAIAVTVISLSDIAVLHLVMTMSVVMLRLYWKIGELLAERAMNSRSRPSNSIRASQIVVVGGVIGSAEGEEEIVDIVDIILADLQSSFCWALDRARSASGTIVGG